MPQQHFGKIEVHHYKSILAEDFLSLPSQGRLRALSQPLNVTDTCSNSPYIYLKKRTEKLTELKRNVILIIDEIYTSKRIEYSKGSFLVLLKKKMNHQKHCYVSW